MEREFDQASTDRLLSALYGDEASEPVELSSDEQAELDSLSELRSLLSSLPDEEPPSSVTAKLLSAAAAPPRKAVSPVAEPGLWARLMAWMQPVFAHPGLAAATSLVLVVAIGSVYYVAGYRDSAAVRSDDEAASAPAAVEKKVSEERPSDGTADLEKAGVEVAPETPALKLDQGGGEGERLQQAQQAKAGRAAPTRIATPKTPAPAPPVKRNRDTSTNLGVGAGTTGQGSGLDVSSNTEIQLGSEPPPPPEPTPTDEDSIRGAPDDAKTDKRATKSKEESSASELAGLRDKARTAAKKGDCARVVSLGKTVRQRDDRYYKKVFVTDGAIRRCYAVSK